MTHATDNHDPVLVLARLLAAMDSAHTTLDAQNGTSSPATDCLCDAARTAFSGIAAIRTAISFLPATSPAGALVHLALANDAAHLCAENDDPEQMAADASACERHLDAALPVLSEALGIDLADFGFKMTRAALPDALRDVYVAQVANVFADVPDAGNGRESATPLSLAIDEYHRLNAEYQPMPETDSEALEQMGVKVHEVACRARDARPATVLEFLQKLEFLAVVFDGLEYNPADFLDMAVNELAPLITGADPRVAQFAEDWRRRQSESEVTA